MGRDCERGGASGAFVAAAAGTSPGPVVEDSEDISRLVKRNHNQALLKEIIGPFRLEEMFRGPEIRC